MAASRAESEIVHALLDAYRQGAFPMADPETGSFGFYTADPRGVIPLRPLDAFHVPASLRRRLRSGWFDVRADTAFEAVMRGCAAPRREDARSWIDERIIAWFKLLHRAGHAHSVEAWRRDPATGRDRLVGGVYGVCLGGAFFAESMFCAPRARVAGGGRHALDGTDASKVCLVRLVEHLRRRGFALLDTQATNPHLARFGCVEIPAADYMASLATAVALPVTWGEFQAGPEGEPGAGADGR